MKVKTHNLKWYLFPWNFKAFKLLFMYIHHSLISLSVLFKHKSFFVNLSLSCLALQYFGWKIFTSCKNCLGQPLRCAYFGAKLVFIPGIFLKKYPWYMKIYFQFYFFAIWSIPAPILPMIAWKGPASSWSPSELAMFFNTEWVLSEYFSTWEQVPQSNMSNNEGWSKKL